MIYLQWSLIYQKEYVFPSKAKDVNVKVFNMITRINRSKSLEKYFSCDWTCRVDVKKCNSN